ncbi:NADPH-dependent FMN reductase [Maribacter sp. 2-571]|uniref:NADPH-dependent FMN reductase n=1 Tax=Maribacter sp. 2-571 TaxID=3417569 RepID=UPI003D32AAB2
MGKPRIFAVSGSTARHSSNAHILRYLKKETIGRATIDIFSELQDLPHFNPDLDGEQLPSQIVGLRKKIACSDAMLVCTPEYVFSLPGSLKNMLEWLVATTLLSQKPTALIVASASGEKAMESLELIVKTLGASISGNSKLLLSGIKGKLDANGSPDPATAALLRGLMRAFLSELQEK